MIYFLEAANGLIKIGYSGNVSRRIKDIAFMSPLPLRLITTMAGTKKQERLIHSFFRRSHGEWFYPDPRLLKYLGKISKGYVDNPGS